MRARGSSPWVVALAAGILLQGLAASVEGREGRTSVQARFSPRGGVTRAVSRAIRDARRSVDVAVYVLSAPSLATDLIAAHKRGVRVRVLLDGRMSRRWSQAGELEEHGVPLHRVRLPRTPEDHSDPQFHHKFAVVDGETVITGSFNWTVMAEERNHENLLLIRDEALARTFSEVFQEAWSRAEEEQD